MYDTFCAVRNRSASMSCRSTDLDQLVASEGADNVWIGVGPLTICLRGVERNGTPYADGESEHLLLTVPECMTRIRSVGGDEDEELEMDISIEPVTPESGEVIFELSLDASIPSA